MDLANLLANRRWLRQEQPFPYFCARDVFLPAVYQDIAAAYQSLLARGCSAGPDSQRFSRTITGYDVYALSLARNMPAPLHIFMSRAWHDVLATVTGVEATGDVNGALHHHPPDSLSGRPHNDLNPGWFSGQAAPGEINLSDPALCSYHTGRSGAASAPEQAARETIRGAALLFYLNNPPWSPGDGGETGCYDSAQRRTEAPTAAIPPINNSLLLFECTARSYHAFIRNRGKVRNSIVMWIHRSKADAVARFSEAAIVGWSGPAVLNETRP